MKKYIILLLCLVLITGCHKNDQSDVNNLAENNSDTSALIKDEINDEKQKVQSNNPDSILEQQKFEVSLEDINNNNDAEWVGRYNTLLETFSSQMLAEEAAEHGQAHDVNYDEEIVHVLDTNHLSIIEKKHSLTP